jgi:hypothetical protein
MPAAARPCRSVLGDPSAPVSVFSDGSPARRRGGPSALGSANAGPRAAQMCALSRAGRHRKTWQTVLGFEVLCRMAIAGFGMMCAHHWSGPNPHFGPGLPTRLPGAPTVNMPYRPRRRKPTDHTDTVGVGGHLPRARVYGIFTSGAPGSLVGNSILTKGRVFRRSGARGAHTEQLDTTAVCARGSEESSFGAARDTDCVLGPHMQAVAATAWAFAPLRSPLVLSLDAWSAQYPTAQCLRSEPSATPAGCRTGTRHLSRHTRRKPAHDVE